MKLKKKTINFLLPGLFICILGIGNVYVGTHKKSEYQRILNSLPEFEQLQDQKDALVLDRIKNLANEKTKNSERYTQAQDRLFLYSLAILSGKLFLSLSIILILYSIYIEQKD